MAEDERTQNMQQVQHTASIDLQAIQDGSGAVVTFSLFGIHQTSIIIPRVVVVAFLKSWVANEKQLQNISQFLTKEKLHA